VFLRSLGRRSSGSPEKAIRSDWIPGAEVYTTAFSRLDVHYSVGVMLERSDAPVPSMRTVIVVAKEDRSRGVFP
jgi:hypothetical protein